LLGSAQVQNSLNNSIHQSDLSPCSSTAVGAAGHHVCTAIVSALAIFIFAATFRAGLDRGMDHLVGGQAAARVANAIAAVMTKERFGEGRYAVSGCVFGLLINHGFGGSSETLKSGAVLDHALERTRRDLPMLSEHCTYGRRLGLCRFRRACVLAVRRPGNSGA
jgi:hypothetical protein